MFFGTVIGHLGADAEVKNTQGREFAVFRVADTNRWTDDAGMAHEETTWVDCIMNGRPKVLDFLKKGQQVYVSGTQTLRVYSSAKDRCMKAGVQINVRQIELLGKKSDDIPAFLYRQDNNAEVKVLRCFNACDLQRGENTEEKVVLVDKSGNKFAVDRDGWVTPEKSE